MKKIFRITALVILGLYVLVCGGLYFFQEKVIFVSEKLEKNYRFSFAQKFEELNIKAKDGKLLNGLLFKSDSARGLLFYLHGNAGSLRSWGEMAKNYTGLNHDVFILDYRGYGKSEGTYTSQKQFFEDVQQAYDEMKKRYPEDKITILGYSLGTGPAAKTAAANNPRILILEAPYYSITDVMRHAYPFIPTFILKYKFETNKYIKACKMPVIIFHGDQDHYTNSLRLKEESFKNADTLIILKGAGHKNITDQFLYKEVMKDLLTK